MKYVTTNIRLPEDLWKSLKMEAAARGRRFTEIVRERLWHAASGVKKGKQRRSRSLCGIWKGVEISDAAVEEAKRALFPIPEKFLK